MEKEYQILSYLQRQEYTSQREIARGTGLSLGTVNILLKRLIRKGLVKIERLDARSLRYILTPSGIAEKTSLTYKYIKHSYAHILRVTQAVDKVIGAVQGQVRGQGAKGGGPKEICLYGPRNEVLEILELALKRGSVAYSYLGEESCLPAPDKSPLLIVWELEDEKKLSQSYQVVNILKIL